MMRLRYVKTEENDLENLVKLWNDGEVMKYVGFPNGLDYNLEKSKIWLDSVNKKEFTMHYCIYDGRVFLGELFYSHKTGEKAIIDIKLFPSARGKNIGFRAICFLLDQLFRSTPAVIATVDPHQENTKAIRLYEKCGFRYQGIRMFEGQSHKVFDLDKASWQKKRLSHIHFEDVNHDNYRSIFDLTVSKEQEHFIAENIFSLAQAAYEKEFRPKAIYCEDNPVGFLMWTEKDKDDGLVWIYRIMIGEHYQGLGYGKKAMEIIIPYLKSISTDRKIRISFEPDNTVAKALYEKMGFVTTGVIEGGEIIYELIF